jgi:hypothetical protein
VRQITPLQTQGHKTLGRLVTGEKSHKSKKEDPIKRVV